MALVIDATLDGATSNSYVTLVEANTYFETQLNASKWDGSTDDIKNRSLVMATSRIDQEDFLGDRNTDTQALKFSRINLPLVDGIDFNGVIPLGVKKATYELANHLLTVNMNTIGVTSNVVKKIEVGSIKITKQVDENDNNSQSYNTLPPYVEDYLADFSSTVSNGAQVVVMR